MRVAKPGRANVTKETENLRKSQVVTGPSSGFDNIMIKRDSSQLKFFVHCAFPRKIKGLQHEIRD